MPRIVSLIASTTEIVCALGCEDQLVGRSHECDYPPSVKELPVCTAPKFDTKGTSLEIDQRVKAIVEKSLSVYHVDAERLRELRPDVILTQSQCEVCAVSQKDVEQAVCDWVDSRPRVVSLAPQKFNDVLIDIRLVGAAIDVPLVKVRGLCDRMVIRYTDILDKAKKQQNRPSVACIEWIAPLMAAGNWVPEMVAWAGGKNLFGMAGEHSPWMTWEQLCQADPQVIVVMPCGYDMAETRKNMPFLTEKPEWPGLRAVRKGRVFLADGNQYFNRPGPRLVESLEILAELFHPDVFHFGHEGSGWERL